jgi:hypothetical protein
MHSHSAADAFLEQTMQELEQELEAEAPTLAMGGPFFESEAEAEDAQDSFFWQLWRWNTPDGPGRWVLAINSIEFPMPLAAANALHIQALNQARSTSTDWYTVKRFRKVGPNWVQDRCTMGTPAAPERTQSCM